MTEREINKRVKDGTEIIRAVERELEQRRREELTLTIVRQTIAATIERLNHDPKAHAATTMGVIRPRFLPHL